MRNKIIILACIFIASAFKFNAVASNNETQAPKAKQIYEWRIYTLNGDGTSLDQFFQSTLIPAYSRLGVKVGAFAPYKKEEKDLRYLLFVYPNMETYRKVSKAVWNDQTFRKAAQPFFDETAPKPVFSDYTTFLCEAFDKLPVMRTPDKDRTLFEFRLYHSPNDEANQRKIKMFNTEEINLFDQVGIHSVCYGEILAGANMPALIYLTWHKDETTRNDAWKRFGSHPDWIKMKGKPEYANTATNNQVKLLSPMEYSQF